MVNMAGRSVVFVKNLLKNSLDNYVLPGTSAGTEILWLYVTTWKHSRWPLIFAFCYFIATRREVQKLKSFIDNPHRSREGNR